MEGGGAYLQYSMVYGICACVFVKYFVSITWVVRDKNFFLGNGYYCKHSN